MNGNNARSINQQLFEQMARFECEASVGMRSYVPCDKPATKVIEWRHQDGDRERRALCEEHAVEEEKYWSGVGWDTCVEVSNIEDWELHISYGDRTATRVGNKVPNAQENVVKLSQTAQRRNSLATIMAYHRFCCQNSRYHHTMSNQLHMMRWIDERRIEMRAEGRPHWVPTDRDFEQAMRDCWDDLVKV